jgi:hypothetical protein
VLDAADGVPTGEVIRHGRPPWWLIILFASVAAVAVGGNFIAGYMERTEPTTTTQPLRSLGDLVAAADHVVVARVLEVELLGEAKDPAVLAEVRVVEDLGRGPAEGTDLTLYDAEFLEAWKVGERALLFLEDDSDPDNAHLRPHLRVVRRGRFLLGEDLAIVPGFSIEDVRAALHQPN